MKIEKASEKLDALNEAMNCIHSVNSVRPGAVSNDTIRLIAELRVDLMDIVDEENAFVEETA